MPGSSDRHGIASVCFVLCLFFFDSLVFANIKQKKNTLNQILERIEKTLKDVKGLQIKKSALLGQLAEIEKAYGEIAGTLKSLQSETENKQQQLLEIERQVIEQQAAIATITGQLEGQVRAAYAMGRMKKLKLLLNQQNAVRANRIMVYYEFLNRERLDKLELTKRVLQDLQRLENEANLAKQKLQNLVLEKKHEQDKLAKTKDARSALLAGLKKQQDSKAGELKQLRSKQAELRRLIDSLQTEKSDQVGDISPGKPFFRQKGRLNWPVSGRLRNRFGSKRGGGKWDGVLIAAKEGTKVQAVNRGRVVFSNWLRGYGLLVIIDHGKGYMTLYAFNQSLYKEEGDWVNQGEIIATVGKSDGRNKAGLYFGIRKKGKPLNPVKWCRKPREGKV